MANRLWVLSVGGESLEQSPIKPGYISRRRHGGRHLTLKLGFATNINGILGRSLHHGGLLYRQFPMKRKHLSHDTCSDVKASGWFRRR